MQLPCTYITVTSNALFYLLKKNSYENTLRPGLKASVSCKHFSTTLIAQQAKLLTKHA